MKIAKTDWVVPRCINLHADLPTFLHSAESLRICTMYSAFHIHLKWLKILRNHKFYRISLDSHQMDVKSLIQGTLSLSKDDLLAVMVYTIANGAYLSGTERNTLRQETKLSWMSFFITFGMILDSVDQMLAGIYGRPFVPRGRMDWEYFMWRPPHNLSGGRQINK